MIDSHCHLDQKPLSDDIRNILKRSKNSGIEKLLTICTTSDSFSKICNLVDFDSIIYGTFGIHPHEANKYSNINLEFILDLKKKFNKIIGIGETGLDYYYNHSDKKAQKESFIKHIHAAIKLDIPLIVHSRNAETDTFDIINSEKKNSNLKVLMHCFTGSKNFARKLIDINCYISVSGIITFKNSLDLQEAVSTIPIKNLLVETDSPYLAPMPHRGKTNEPSLIVHTIEKLAEIKKTSKENVISCTSNNFKNLFKII